MRTGRYIFILGPVHFVADTDGPYGWKTRAIQHNQAILSMLSRRSHYLSIAIVLVGCVIPRTTNDGLTFSNHIISQLDSKLNYYLANATAIAGGQDSRCDDISAPIEISTDSIGPIPANGTLNEIYEICPQAYEAVYQTEHRYPALLVPFDGLTAVAVQHKVALKFDQPPDVWVLFGTNAILPEGISIKATWHTLFSAYGPRAYANAEFGPVFVRFCSQPAFSFQLTATDQIVGSIEVTQDLSKIPDNAQIVKVSMSVAYDRFELFTCDGM